MKYTLYLSIGGEFGVRITARYPDGVTYEDAVALLNKEELIRQTGIDAMGYTADDIKAITPEQYDEEFGEEEE